MRIAIPDYSGEQKTAFYYKHNDIFYEQPLTRLRKPPTGKRQQLWLSKKSYKKPTFVVRFGAASSDITNGQTVVWDGHMHDFTNADDKSLSLIATNICKLTGIGSYG